MKKQLKEIIPAAAVLAALAAVFTVLYVKMELPPVPWIPAYAALCVLAVILIYLFPKKNRSQTKLHPALGTVMLDAVKNVYMPVIIAEEDGTMVWYNSAAVSAAGKGIGTMRFEEAFIPEGEDKCTSASGRIFRVHKNDISASDKPFVLYSLTDITEAETCRKLLADRDIIVAHILVDNLDDLIRQEQEEYRSASAAVAEVMSQWAASVGGVIKEYQRDRYIFLFEAEHLREFVERRFDILDRIREVRVKDRIPVTVSVGVGDVDGDLSARERAAAAALETALQRGGDQVAVRGRDGELSLYGGRTKTVQKRTKVKTRVFAGELVSYMSAADNVLIMGHRFCDFDSVGSAVGLARMAMFCGVEVNIVCDTSDRTLSQCRGRLAGLREYEDMFVSAAEAQDLIRPYTLLVIADVNNPNLFEAPRLVNGCRTMAIVDHHRKTGDAYVKDPDLNYIDPSASSASEIVAEMLEQVLPPEQLTADEAALMLAGILLDTKQFVKNTGTRTFSAALYLRDRGADVGETQELFRTDLDDFMREAKFRSNIVIYRSVTAISLGEGEGDSRDRITAAKAADRLLEVEGVKASFALIPIGDAIHISARSTGSVNVQLILEKLRGGGHFDAAGAQVPGCTVTQALVKLKEAIDEYFLEEGM